MNKLAAILMFFLGASFMLQVAQATPTAKECVIGYYDIAPPEKCTYYIDDEGEEEEECTSVGSAAFAAALNSGNANLVEPNFPLSEIDPQGDCDCTLTVWSKDDLTGCSVTEEVKDETVYVFPGIWKRAANPKSWELLCRF